jgi:selenocysteine-specific elongation factor
MVAGATGIDIYLMAVAADDGVMPQTREHAAVLAALDVRTGVVAITKSDLTDPEPAMAEAAELLLGAEVVNVSARTGAGLDELLAAIDRAAARISSRADGARATPARLHIDRVFTIKGAGTVVTGTLWSGSIRHGDEVLIQPEGVKGRVRGVQVHDEALEEVLAGQRVAVNLSGVAVDEVARGDVLVSRDEELRPTFLIDAALELADEPAGRVQVHHGTRETPARLAWLGGRFWQLRLEQPLVPATQDRLIIRSVAPPDTLGGGVVLDAHPRKHGPSPDVTVRLERLQKGQPSEQGQPSRGSRGVATRAKVVPAPLTPSALALEQRLEAAGLEPPLDAELDAKDLAALREAGRAIRVSRQLHYHPDVLASVREQAIALAERNGGAVTLAALRDELGTSRKFAQALIEHLDAERVTIRRGDEHYLRRGAATQRGPLNRTPRR